MVKIGISTASIGNIRAGTWVYTYNLLKFLMKIDLNNRYYIVNDGGDDCFDLSCERLQFKGGVRGKLNKIVWPNFVLQEANRKIAYGLRKDNKDEIRHGIYQG